MLRNIIAVMPYFYRAQRLWAVTGIPALLPPAAADTLELPAETALAYQNVLKGRPATIGAIAAELAALEAYYEEVRAADIDSLGQLPLVVLRHGRPLAYEGIAPETNQLMEAAWQQFQAELAAQSTRGELLVAVDSGHNIMLDQPELVVETIVRVVTAAQEDAAIAGR